MGRRPNPLILNYFERGPKLNDNSNRYRHTCKSCGADFPKGRIETLQNHITKACPAISEAERINACIALHVHGLNGSGSKPQSALSQVDSQANTGSPVGVSHPLAQNNWTALETLAEVSRQIDLSEKHDDHQPNANGTPQHATQFDASQAPIPNPLLAPVGSNPFELQEQFTLENPPLSYENRPQREKRGTPQDGIATSHYDHTELTTEEKLQSLLAQVDASQADSNLSVAVAATARLNPSLLDPQLQVLTEDSPMQTTSDQVDLVANVEDSGDIPTTTGASAESAIDRQDDMMLDYTTPERASSPINGHDSASSSWGEMTYIPDATQPAAIVSDQSQQLAMTLNKGGFRMDTTSPNGTRTRHTRARFDSSRRKEVQEVRRIGACIRCRILRKTCSKGTPCDTCRKVLSPRVWRTGCTRTKLAEQIELYSAGVQIVIAQKRVNKLKADYKLTNNGTIVEASHFHETGIKMTLQVLHGLPVAGTPTPEDQAATLGEVIMIDNDKVDVPAQVENYMRQMLPELIQREPSNLVRVTLECAVRVAQETNDELLRRALELWGLVEMMDRERHWSFLRKASSDASEGVWINESENFSDTFTNLCMQLTAGAERKAAATSKSLLNGIQRNLQDGKTKLGFPMFLTAMVFLNCVEKTSWAFKAWAGEALQSLWPLERQPSNFYNQGYGLCDLLRMLLVIRHILPKVSAEDGDSVIVAAEDEDGTIRQYYQDLNVTPNLLRSRHENPNFDQSDSRSLEFLFCSTLLLP